MGPTKGSEGPLNLSPVDVVCVTSTTDDTELIMFGKQRLGPQRTKDGRRFFDVVRFNNRTFVLFIKIEKSQEPSLFSEDDLFCSFFFFFLL